MAKLTPKDIDSKIAAGLDESGDWIKVGMSTCGMAAGAGEVFSTLQQEAKKRNLEVRIKKCGCQGMCYAEPLVEVHCAGLPDVVYGRVDKETAIKILEKHISAKTLVNDNIYEVRTKRQA